MQAKDIAFGLVKPGHDDQILTDLDAHEPREKGFVELDRRLRSPFVALTRRELDLSSSNERLRLLSTKMLRSWLRPPVTNPILWDPCPILTSPSVWRSLSLARSGAPCEIPPRRRMLTYQLLLLVKFVGVVIYGGGLVAAFVSVLSPSASGRCIGSLRRRFWSSGWRAFS